MGEARCHLHQFATRQVNCTIGQRSIARHDIHILTARAPQAYNTQTSGLVGWRLLVVIARQVLWLVDELARARVVVARLWRRVLSTLFGHTTRYPMGRAGKRIGLPAPQIGYGQL